MKTLTGLKDLILRYGTIAMTGLVALVFEILEPTFLSASSIVNLLLSGSILLVLTLGKSVCLAAGGFDISIGTTASLAGVVAAVLLIWFEAPLWMAILVPLIIGALIGLCNGLLIMSLGISDILATLGMSLIQEGVLLTIGKGNVIYEHMTNPWTNTRAPGMVPASFRFLGTGYVGPIPVLVLCAFSLAMFVHVMLNHTRWGRYFYLVGSNPVAARLSGINVKWTKILSYMICSAFAALTGILLLARVGSGIPQAGDPYIFAAVLSAFIGYTVLAAGKAHVPGSIIGVVFTSILVNGLIMAGVHPYSVDIFRGLALVVAVAMQTYQELRSEQAY